MLPAGRDGQGEGGLTNVPASFRAAFFPSPLFSGALWQKKEGKRKRRGNSITKQDGGEGGSLSSAFLLLDPCTLRVLSPFLRSSPGQSFAATPHISFLVGFLSFSPPIGFAACASSSASLPLRFQSLFSLLPPFPSEVQTPFLVQGAREDGDGMKLGLSFLLPPSSSSDNYTKAPLSLSCLVAKVCADALPLPPFGLLRVFGASSSH